jgi:integral membrane protein
MKKFFRLLTFLEGISNVLLILVAVPVKYFLGNDFFVKLLGMPHGLLFVAYCIMAIYFALSGIYKWDVKNLVLILLASIVPFGTFWVDKKYLR